MHYHAFTLLKFVEGISNAPASLQPILQQLCQLHACHVTSENASEFLAAGYFTAPQMNEIQSRVMKLCQALRPQAVNLVDSFGFSDYVINSPLGRYDGDIYRAYFDLVRQNNPQETRPPYFESVLKPLLTADYENTEGHRLEIDEAFGVQEEDLTAEDDVDTPVSAVGRPHRED